MRTLKISLLVFILSITISAQEGWFWQNPLPQGNGLHAVDFVNSDIGWAVGECRHNHKNNRWWSELDYSG